MTLAWKQQTPTEEGLYWMADGDDYNEAVIVQVCETSALYGGQRYIMFMGTGNGTYIDAKSEPGSVWCGPLKPPTG